MDRRKTVTILFCDVVGSTELGERLDPEVVRSTMSRYFEVARAVIERHGGTVEKFIGDAVMAVFGIPRLHEDDALRAARAGEELRSAFADADVAIRIGINTGQVVTGVGETLGSGDAFNVAARLQQSASPGEVLVGAETYALVRGAVDVEQLAPLDVKGKADPLSAYRLLGVREPGDRRMDIAMVGRVREMARLRQAFAQAVADCSCQLFTLLGSAGVGKSRLALEFLTGLDGTAVARGRCLSYGEGITYWPVLEAIRRLGEAGGSGATDVIARLVSGGDQRVSSAAEIAWATRKLFESAAATGPLVVVFDDIHWGEETFLDLVEQVVDLSRGAPILILCLARPELLDRRPTWSGGKLNATTVLLEPLDQVETGLLIDQLAGTDDGGLRDRITRASEGNPLFVEEMVTLLRESGESTAVPPTIQALLAARLDLLEGADRRVLECGAVEGRVFHHGAVQTMAPDESQLTARLMRLVQGELIRPDIAQLQGEDAYRFRHELVRDAAYEGLPKASRAVLHERLADWLVQRAPDRELDEIVAYHLEQAYRCLVETQSLDDDSYRLAARASELLGAVGRRALDRGDAPAGCALLERALSQVPDDAASAPGLLLDLGSALIAVGNLEKAEARLAESVRSARANDDAVIAQQASVALAGVRSWTTSDHLRGVSDLRAAIADAIPVFEERGDELGLARAYKWLAEVHNSVNGGVCGRRDALEQALAHARAAGTGAEISDIMTYLPSTLLVDDTPALTATRRLEQLLEQDDTGLPAQLITRDALSDLYVMLGRFEDADRERARASAIGEEFGLRFHLARMRQGGDMFYLPRGDPVAAEREIRWAFQTFGEMGEDGRRWDAATRLALTLYHQGRYDEAQQLVVMTAERDEQQDAPPHPIRLRVESLLYARRDRAEDAERTALKAVAMEDELDSPTSAADALLDLAEVFRLLGRPNDGEAPATRALELYKVKGDVTSATHAQSVLANLQHV